MPPGVTSEADAPADVDEAERGESSGPPHAFKRLLSMPCRILDTACPFLSHPFSYWHRSETLEDKETVALIVDIRVDAFVTQHPSELFARLQRFSLRPCALYESKNRALAVLTCQ